MISQSQLGMTMYISIRIPRLQQENLLYLILGVSLSSLDSEPASILKQNSDYISLTTGDVSHKTTTCSYCIMQIKTKKV